MILNYQPSNHDFQICQKKEYLFTRNSKLIELNKRYENYLFNLIESNRTNTKCIYWFFVLNIFFVQFFFYSRPHILSIYTIVISFWQLGVFLLNESRIENFTLYLKYKFKFFNFLSFNRYSLNKSVLSSQKIKCVYLIIILFLPGPLYCSEQKNFTTPSAIENCPDESLDQKPKYQLEYDENLFNELKMYDTLLNLYRSCYKYKFNDLKSSKYNPKPGQNTCKKKPITSNEILVGLLFNKENTLLPKEIWDRINTVCTNDQVNDLYKIFLLDDYEHSLCGNIYRNSIKSFHLDDYILGRKRIERRTARSISNHHHHHHNRQHNSIEKQYSSKNSKIRDTSFKNLSYSIKVNSVEPNDSRIQNYSNITEFHDFETKNRQLVKKLNNCTLILLNIYLLSHKATCDFEDFVESLNHFDCLSNNFSVKSDCNKCQNAYKKWLCSEMIPYYHEKDKLAKPCQRYCYNVQNLCPFFRPVDNYGGQPVFNCRNVIQVLESRPDGYEDDDENYIDEDKYDDDRCYGECNNNQNQTTIQVDLSRFFKEKIDPVLISSNVNDSLYISWLKKRQGINVEKLLNFPSNETVSNKTFNLKGRFKEFDECFFGLQPVSTSSGQIFEFKKAYNIFFFVILKLFIPF